MASGNGTHRWELERDPIYEQDCETLRARHSRAQHAIAAVERQLERLPTFNAEELENDLWLYVTQSGFDVPQLAVWYSVRPNYRVNLLSIFPTDEHGNP